MSRPAPLTALGRGAHDAPMTARVAPLLAGLVLLTLVHPRAQELTLDEVMANAAAYVAEFEQQLSAIVAEETYVQRANNYIPRGAP